MNYTVYILGSLKNGKRYVGYTSKDVFLRLRQHNYGCNRWTRSNRPFKLIYKEIVPLKRLAIQRERFLKSGQGRKIIDEILENRVPR